MFVVLGVCRVSVVLVFIKFGNFQLIFLQIIFQSLTPLLYSFPFPFFLCGKSKVINCEIIPWFEDTHDLLSRLLSWNGCSKRDDEMKKGLCYLIFINQHDFTFFSCNILFHYKRRSPLLLRGHPLSCSIPFPVLASFSFGRSILMI